MNDLHSSLSLLFAELTNGPSSEEAYMLNRGDPGLLRSLDALSAEAASEPPVPGAASIAAHVDHVCYGLDLMNRWSDGEADPWSGADWTASWSRTTVTEGEWAALRERLRLSTGRWQRSLQKARQMSVLELNGVIASIVHLAYHLGAIRQIDRSIQGPRAT
jgi:DinB family protein